MSKMYHLTLNINDEVRLEVHASDPIRPEYQAIIEKAKIAICAMQPTPTPTPTDSPMIQERDTWSADEIAVIKASSPITQTAISEYRLAFPNSTRTTKAITVRHAKTHTGRSHTPPAHRYPIPSHNDNSWIVPNPTPISNRLVWSDAENEVIRRAGCVSHARYNYRLAFPNSTRTDKSISIRYDRLRQKPHPDTTPEPIVETPPTPKPIPISTGMEVTLYDPIPEEPDHDPSSHKRRGRPRKHPIQLTTTPAPIKTTEKKPRINAWLPEEDDILRKASAMESAIYIHRVKFPHKRTPDAIQTRWRNMHGTTKPDTIPAPEPVPEPEISSTIVTHDPADLPDTLLRHLLVSTSAQDAIDRYRQQYRGPKPYSDDDIRTIFRSMNMPVRIGVIVETRVGLGKETICGKIKSINRNDPMYVVVDCKKGGSITIDPVSIYREYRIVRPQSPEIQDDPPALSSPLSSQVAA